MSTPRANESVATNPPVVRRDSAGEVERGTMLDAIGWFIEHDPRVAVIRHPHVEELFRWKQSRSPEEAASFQFNSAEDRLAVGIYQSLIVHDTEEELHSWITQLMSALQDAQETVEAITDEYQLDSTAETSALARAAKLPGETERGVFLTACWLEVLCTAEARVLGWIYQSLYETPFHPDNFLHQ